MKTTSLPLVLLAVAAFLLGGCGTVANFVTLKPKVYGGLEQDEKFFSGGTLGLGEMPSGRGALLALGLVFAAVPAEFCCTAVADTMTLPITMLLEDDWLPPGEEPFPDHTCDPVEYSLKVVVPPSQALEGTSSVSATSP